METQKNKGVVGDTRQLPGMAHILQSFCAQRLRVQKAAQVVVKIARDVQDALCQRLNVQVWENAREARHRGSVSKTRLLATTREPASQSGGRLRIAPRARRPRRCAVPLVTPSRLSMLRSSGAVTPVAWASFMMCSSSASTRSMAARSWQGALREKPLW